MSRSPTYEQLHQATARSTSPTHALTKKSVVSVATLDNGECQAEVQEDTPMDQDLVKHGLVQVLASMGHAPTYDDYANEMSRDCRYRTLLVTPMLVESPKPHLVSALA